jgi:sugar phosphate isomerase/epimerase
MRTGRWYAASAAAALALAACSGGGQTPVYDLGQVEDALRRAGLAICATSTPSRLIEITEGEWLLEVGRSCADGDTAVVDVIAWPDEAARDHALRRFESQSRPVARNHGTTWALGLFTVHVSGERDDDAVERVAQAMRRLGAS